MIPVCLSLRVLRAVRAFAACLLLSASLWQPLKNSNAQTPVCVTPPPGMIAWYKGDGNAVDIQNSYNGAPQSGVSFLPGRVAQAFNLDGTGGVTVAHNAALNPTQFTLDAWVYPTQLDGDVEIIVNKENNPFRPGTVQYEMGIRGTAVPSGSIPVGNFCFFIGNINGLPDQYAGWVDSTAAVPLNQWTHVALTFDGTTARTFVNGNLTRTVNNLSGSGANSNGPFKIGSRSNSVLATNPNAPFNGRIDEVELFGRALTQAEIQSIVNAGSAGKCVPAVCGRPSFSTRVNCVADTVPSAVAAGDFNGDGRLDLVTSNYQANTISIMPNVGDGSFGPPTQLAAGTAPQFITVTDLNSDNRLDVVIANALSGNIAVYSGNGNGTFNAPVTYTVGTDPRGIAVGDLNSDGRPDLAVTNMGSGTISILLNNGAGLLNAAAPVTLARGIRFVSIADLNADGRADLAATNQQTDKLAVALGNGNGTFNAPVTYETGKLPQGLAVGDYNSDGYLDLAVANTTNYNVSIFLNDGRGAYANGVTYPLPPESNPGSVIAGDFNGDGKLDLATSNYSTNDVSILLGNGVGAFTSLNNFAMGPNPQHLVAGDFNGDGKLDIATANLNGGNVTVRYNNCEVVPANAPPSIALASGGVFVRQQGSAATTATLATVADAETVPNNLVVTAAMPTGITVSNIVNNNGVVTANIAANCNATPGANSVLLTVTDGGLVVTNATLTVNVLANTPPALGNYVAPAALSIGGNVTINSSAPPTDNGTIASVTATAAGLSGTLLVNPMTGVIAVGNARPDGTFSIVVTATDNCGATASQTVSLTINKFNATLALAVSSGPYIAGQAVSFMATPAGVGGIFPSGTVTFFDGATALGTATIGANGQAVLTTNALIAGARQITAVYNGNGNYNAATSAVAVVAVARAATNVSAASYVGEVLAPEQIVSAFGVNLATETRLANTLPLPTSLAGTIVRVRDSANAERLAPLFYVSPGQINYLMPAGTARGAALVTITDGNGGTSMAWVTIAATAGGAFSANASGSGIASADALRVRANGSFSYEPTLRLDGTTNVIVSVPLDLGAESDQVFLILYGTGIREQRSVTATIGGVNAPVVYAGPQGRFAGLDQANIRIPRALIGRGDVDVALTVDGRPVNIVRINVR